ncbi:MAG TPA: hypothetical protein VGI64_21000 [Streptosporangiaceae bacterium]|jgi:hypothetical protein
MLTMIANVGVVPDARAESGAGVLLSWGVGAAKPVTAGAAAVVCPAAAKAAGPFGPVTAGIRQEQPDGQKDLNATYAHKTRIAASSGELGPQPAREPEPV